MFLRYLKKCYLCNINYQTFKKLMSKNKAKYHIFGCFF